MKRTFPGYYPPSDEEFAEMWKNCIFVFDANALLNLYRYSKETTLELIKILISISERLWLPHQAALEYQQNRLNVMAKEQEAYEELQNVLDKTQNKLKAKVLSERHPFVKDPHELVKKTDSLFDEIRSNLKRQKDEYMALFARDTIKATITNLYEGKVGKPYSEEELAAKLKEGERRYEKRVPPGYEDLKDKSDGREYGDFILWSETLDKAREVKRPVILVTDEKKGDWWQIFQKKIVGPRPELIEEMLTNANVSFYMYRVDPFMENVEKYLDQKVERKAVKEVRGVRQRDEQRLRSESHVSEALRKAVRGTGIHAGGRLGDLVGYGSGDLPSVTADARARTHRVLDALGRNYPRELASDIAAEYDLTRRMLEKLGGVPEELARETVASSAGRQRVLDALGRNYPRELASDIAAEYDLTRRMLEKLGGVPEELARETAGQLATTQRIQESIDRAGLSGVAQEATEETGHTSDEKTKENAVNEKGTSEGNGEKPNSKTGET